MYGEMVKGDVGEIIAQLVVMKSKSDYSQGRPRIADDSKDFLVIKRKKISFKRQTLPPLIFFPYTLIGVAKFKSH